MIEYIKGRIAEITPATITIETPSGIAFGLNIALTTYDSLHDKNEACLYVHEAIREDAWVLYGFLNQRERELFRSLVGVSGVGASTARIILSSIPAAELEAVIVNGDYSRLKNVKGIGQKTAQRIIVDLRDKIKPQDDTLLNISPDMSSASEEALAALVALGFARQAAAKVLNKIYHEAPGTKVEVAVRKALTML
ncbi:MAG: Holliday junction branch migration protein RuvA [Muribaculaceae bacterium]